MAFNTGNALGSTDPRDFSDNSENLDQAVNDLTSPTWVDRLGNTRTTLAGQIGYIGTGVDGAIESYTAGLVLTTYSTIILYSGEFYRPSASATLPYTTTATTPDVDSNLVAVGDAVIRQDLANSAAGFGSELVARSLLQKKSIAEVEALTGTVNNIVYLDSGGRSGHFYWDAANLSTVVTADTQQGIYIAPSSDPTGASGAWVRQYSGAVNVEWFGLSDPSPSIGQSTEFQSILDSYTLIEIPEGVAVLLDATVNSQDSTTIFGGGKILVDNINGIEVGNDTTFDNILFQNTATGGSVSFNALAIRMDASVATGKGVALSGLTIKDCEFIDMFYGSYATGDETFRISDIRITGTKSTAPASVNAGHFQHRYADRCYAIGNECFNGQNASSYNYVNDCHDILVANNYDYNNSYASCEIENSGATPARAIVVNNVFNGTPGIWIDDSSDVLLDGNTLTDGILITTQIVAVNNIRVSDNIMSSLSAGDFSTPDPAAEITNLIVNNNTTTGVGSKAWAFLFDDYVKTFQLYDNTAKGTYSSGALSLVRTSDTDAVIRNNQFGVASVISGSGGKVVAFDNDVFSNQGSTHSESQFNSVNLSSVLPEQNEIAGTANQDFTFNIPITPQFSGRLLKIYGTSRNQASGNVDTFVIYGHTFFQASRLVTLGTIQRTGSTSASDVSVTGSYVADTATHDILTLNVTNNNASDTIKCRIHVDVGTGIQ